MWLLLVLIKQRAARQNGLPGGNGVLEPPDPISNSEVKRYIADGSVGLPHVRVGHCQALNNKPPVIWPGVFYFQSFIQKPARARSAPEGLRTRMCADKVGHCQALNLKPLIEIFRSRVFYVGI